MSELIIRPVLPEELPALAEFMSRHGGQPVSADYLQHWYYRNPTGSASVITGWIDGRIVGMATTNDHLFQRLGADPVLVGMPQKVMTDPALRGQGIFGKLYKASESACRDRGVGFFLTVTNAASTPIFLSRFGYKRLPSPRLVFLPPSWGRVQTRPLDTVPILKHVPELTDTWRMRKDAEHYAWRYAGVSAGSCSILEVGPSERPFGVLVVRRIQKMRLPFLVLMDVVPYDEGTVTGLLRAARCIARSMGTIGVLVLKEHAIFSWLEQEPFRVERSSGFNLLVKGRDDEHSDQLLSTSFELAFGDLDFL